MYVEAVDSDGRRGEARTNHPREEAMTCRCGDILCPGPCSECHRCRCEDQERCQRESDRRIRRAWMDVQRMEERHEHAE